MRLPILLLPLLFALVPQSCAWSKEDHEIFRLRDELLTHESPNVTFYSFLNIPPAASQDDINKASRSLSRKWHPDKAKQAFIASRAAGSKPKSKSKKPGVQVSKPPSESEITAHVKKASERYARLGVVTAILRGPSRERYDFFLANGFPAWKGTGYYYARYRPGLGTVLAGLFVFGGGLVHYGALYLSWKRQREFVERYVRHARKTAWGDELGIKGIPGLDSPGSSATISAPPGSQEEVGQAVLNRRQKRLQEKESRKESAKSSLRPKSSANGNSGTATPSSEALPVAGPTQPFGARKKVQAENGKVLIVDSVGQVFLEEEDEDGNRGEYLLDPDEIAKPTWRDTVLVRLPIWGVTKIRLVLGKQEIDGRILGESRVDEGEDAVEGERRDIGDGNARRRARRNGKVR